MSLQLQSNIVYYTAVGLGVLASLFFLRIDWKKYGLLFLISGSTAVVICYLFVKLKFYSFPYVPIHNLSVPLYAMLVTFPAGVLFGVRYSPEKWVWKIPFYWGIVHVGVFAELLVKQGTNIFEFDFEWDVWDSYTWWWIYFLLFEWIGGKIVPDSLRKPISEEQFRYGNWGWLVFHTIVITTIFLGGFYVGRITNW